MALSTCYFPLSFCSISKMTSLKQLDLSENNLSRDERLSDKLSELTNLETLDLSDCELKEIPDGYVSDTCLIIAAVCII